MLVVAACGMAACATVTSAPRHHHRHDGPPPTTAEPGTTTSTTSAFPQSFNVGIWTFYWKDTSRGTVNPLNPAQPIPGRVLTTEVRYPTLGGSKANETPGARPARAEGPFPVIVFAHGFGLDPIAYAPLLDSWVRDGFVVVSPIFPDESATEVASLGGPSTSGGYTAETDQTNEPADIAYVLKQLGTAVSGTPVAHIADLSKVALAGQSDGGNVVGALAFGNAYASIWSSIKPAPKAVAILSGQGLEQGPGGTTDNTYGSGPTSPALLQVQSITDACNFGPEAFDLFNNIDHGPVHLFETLTNATHLDPYIGVQPWAAIVETVTAEFFKVELGWHDRGLSLATVVSAGTVPGTSSMAPPSAATFASSPTQMNCSLPPGLDTGAS